MKQRNKASLAYRFKKYLTACVIAATSGVAVAQEMTAGSIYTNMSGEERVAFLSGVIEGLAYARYEKDGQDSTGMVCIYKWFYDDPGYVLPRIRSAFEHFADYNPGAVLAVMIEQECGS